MIMHKSVLKAIDYIKYREQKLINKIIVLLLKTNHCLLLCKIVLIKLFFNMAKLSCPEMSLPKM